MFDMSKEQLAIIQTHLVVAYWGIKPVTAALGYQVMKRNPTEETAAVIERELLNTILEDHDTFFQWVEDFMDGKF